MNLTWIRFRRPRLGTLALAAVALSLLALTGCGKSGSESKLGVKVKAPSSDLADNLKLPKDKGLVVEEVEPNGLASKVGVEKGDVLLEVNGKPVPRDVSGLTKLAASLKSDDKFELLVKRDGKEKTLPEGSGTASRDGGRDIDRDRDRRDRDGEDRDRRERLGAGDKQLDDFKKGKFGGTDDVTRDRDRDPSSSDRDRDRDPGRGTSRPRAGKPDEDSLGAKLSKPSMDLAKQLKLKGGLKIDDVTRGSAAFKAGLKPDDLLLSIDDQDVPSDKKEFGKILAGIKPDTNVDAVVLRDGERKKLKISLPEGRSVVSMDQPLKRRGEAPVLDTDQSDDEFNQEEENDGVTVRVRGRIVNGKGRALQIEVQDVATFEKYSDINKVPERFRPKVEELIKKGEKQLRDLKKGLRD